MTFPTGFLWGASTSAYQIEGGASADGRSPSVWDSYCRKPGAVYSGHHGDIACDHYHRAGDDVKLMREIGLRAYRFSISWSRVMPEGTGAVNAKGIGFYDRLVDSLMAAGIQPWATLFHWDLPQCLHDRGGWMNRDISAWFAEYTRAVVDALSDRVKHWMTLNEPQCFIGGGPDNTPVAPDGKLELKQQLQMNHHALMAHGRAVQVIRSRSAQPSLVGWAPVGVVFVPVSDDPADIAAAERATYSITQRNMWNNTWCADAVCKGVYPEDGLKLFADVLPPMEAGDLAVIHQPLDFYGLNIYNGTPVRASADAPGGFERVARAPGFARTAFDWPVDPQSLDYGPRLIHKRYGLPIYITENGLSGIDWVAMDGRVHDAYRIDFTRRYLIELRRAIRAGADIRGYLHWSLMDNFEWADGYRQRFGLIHVDFTTLKRTLKDSARWYGRVIESNGAILDDVNAM